MKDQVTSFEQPKRLIEMGVPAQKASMVWITGYFFGEPTSRAIMKESDDCILSICRDRSMLMGDNIVPAFTVADLLGIIKPLEIMKVELNPSLEKIGKEEWMFEFGEFTGEEICGFARNKSLVELLVGRIEWMVSNGYELNLQ